MKRSIVILVLGMFSTGLLFANNMQKERKDLMEKLTTELALTQQQQTQIAPIVERFETEATQIRKTYTNKEERKAAIKPLKKQMKQDVKTFLTDEQIAKWKELKKERKGNKGRKGQGERGQRG